VAERLSNEIPNSVWMNQYDNLANRQAHYESTGPEIWKQTDGTITHLCVGVGTGGTISGTAKYLKEQNPNIKIWGVDSYGSVFKKYHETGIFDEKEIYPYALEGVGEDILPKNVDFDLIDHFEKVTDKDAAVDARKLAKEEGIFIGYSCGAALTGLLQMADQLTKDDVVVLIFHDHGSRYVGKVYNDDWMIQRGFMDKELRVRDLLAKKKDKTFHSLDKDAALKEALSIMKDQDISQMPITSDGEIIGSLTQNKVLNYILENPLKHADRAVSEIMDKEFPKIAPDTPLKDLNKYITREVPAVLTVDANNETQIITQYDIIQAL
jgi:cystathionine beta-synthase